MKFKERKAWALVHKKGNIFIADLGMLTIYDTERHALMDCDIRAGEKVVRVRIVEDKL